ncbi:MAG: GNAT family N-acetyltransferase [Verrucomicrobiota bacterium]|nr:GNAT family N-acetyltransferase [Verrucomicrobiota bacterium]
MYRSTMVLTIEHASVESDETRRLMAELCAEIDQLYGNDIHPASNLSRMDQPGAAFLLARQGGAAIGCAALRPLTRETAEVKRMYVQPHARRAGAARALMHELHQLARAAGFNEIWLETGLLQPAAIRLYESLGYTRIAAFGDYKDDPANVGYGKRLT